MAASTTNVTLTPGGGWVALTSAAVTAFLRLSKTPHHIPVFLQVGSTTPTVLSGGFRWDCGETFFEGALSLNVYARIQNNANGNVVVSVFAN